MFDFYFTLAVIILMIIALLLEIQRPSFIMFATLILLYLAGVIPLNEVFSGFSNEGMLTIAALFIIAAALQSSTGFRAITRRMLGSGSKLMLYPRLMIPVALFSAFMNNTTVVATWIPHLKRWSKDNNFPLSKLLIPLSYAAIIGGMCTLIGTSTNLIIHGLLIDSGFNGFTFFELGKFGLPVVVMVIIYFTLVGRRLLPDRKDSFTRITETTREFVVEVRIEKKYPHLEKTIEEAGLRHLRGLFLFQITRGQNEIAPVGPKEELLLGDRLFFTGIPESIYDLLQMPGLHLIKDSEFDISNIDSDKFSTYEAVISNASPLIGETVKESEFRTRYNAVILAIHRHGHRLNQKIGEIELQANDTLFILARKDFGQKWYNSTDFALVSSSFLEYSKPKLKGNLALFFVILMILLVITGIIPSMLVASLLVAGFLILFKIISYHDAKKAISLDVLLVIVSAIGIGRAVDHSGLAQSISGSLIKLLEPYGTIAILGGLFLITTVFTELITNNAAAAIVFPLAIYTAKQLGLDPMPLVITVTLAASTSFSTPIGYQTNMMIYSTGGYRFCDYLKTGIPLNLLTGIIVVLSVYTWYFI